MATAWSRFLGSGLSAHGRSPISGDLMLRWAEMNRTSSSTRNPADFPLGRRDGSVSRRDSESCSSRIVAREAYEGPHRIPLPAWPRRGRDLRAIVDRGARGYGRATRSVLSFYPVRLRGATMRATANRSGSGSSAHRWRLVVSSAADCRVRYVCGLSHDEERYIRSRSVGSWGVPRELIPAGEAVRRVT